MTPHWFSEDRWAARGLLLSVIALNLAAGELRAFRERFASVVRNWWDIMRQQKRLTWFTAGYSQTVVVFPFIVVAQRYFRGRILLGGLMQTVRAFGQVQDSLSFIVSSYTDIAAWRSVVERLAVSRVRSKLCVIVSGVDLDLPSGELLVINVNFSSNVATADLSVDRRARERARSFVLSPVFGLSGAVKSVCR
jgi:hypothetical protein